MSKNIFEVYTSNPITTNNTNDLMYFGRSPYGITDDTAMLFSSFSAQFVKSLNSLKGDINIVAGAGIDVTPSSNDIIISLTGTGASAGYGAYFGRNPVQPSVSFTDTSTWKIVSIPLNLDSSSVNYVVGNDSFGTFLRNIGPETDAVIFSFTIYLARHTNSTANGYYISPFISADGVSAPIVYNGSNDIAPVGVRTQNSGVTDTSGTVPISYLNILNIPSNGKIYMAIRNNGSNTPANNDLDLDTGCIVVAKIGDVGGASSGVVSLNGLTGSVDLISDGSVSVNVVGSDIQLSIGQYQVVSGASQSLIANKSYLATNVALTSFSLPTSGCPAGSFINVAGSGNGLFSITQSAGQNIVDGTSSTTVGATGHLDVTAGNPYSSVKLLCIADNLGFMVINSQGNFTLV